MSAVRIASGTRFTKPDGTENIYNGGTRYTEEELEAIYVKRYYSTEEVARKLKISKKKIYEILSQGISAPEIAYRTKKRLQFSQSDIEKIENYMSSTNLEKLKIYMALPKTQKSSTSDFWN